MKLGLEKEAVKRNLKEVTGVCLEGERVFDRELAEKGEGRV